MLAVFFVVLVVIRDDVVQCKAVVTRDEIDTLLELALLSTIDTWAAKQTICCASDRIIRTPEEVADIVAKPVVPLPPAVTDKGADLIESCRVPRLGDHFCACERRIGLDVPKHRRV